MPGDVPLELVSIPPGSFLMGRYPGEYASWASESPQHSVTIGYDFHIGKYELTKEQWRAVMNTTPWSGELWVIDDPKSPAVYISWKDIAEEGGFLDALNNYLASTGQGVVRLPSESEWEYVCRAGTTTRFYWGDDLAYTEIGNYEWYADNAGIIGEEYAHLVGQKLPNPWGLYDMSGNVFEWCQDWYHNYSSPGRPDDGSAWESPTGTSRVMRGGRTFSGAPLCRSACRPLTWPDNRWSSIGVRLVWTEH